MPGTAKTEEEEFLKFYGLGVVSIPTNKPLVRDDQADIIYKSKEENNVEEKLNAIKRAREIYKDYKDGDFHDKFYDAAFLA